MFSFRGQLRCRKRKLRVIALVCAFGVLAPMLAVAAADVAGAATTVGCVGDTCAGEDPAAMGCGSDAETKYSTNYKGGFWELRFSEACASAWLRTDMDEAVTGRGYIVGYRCAAGSGDCRGQLESRTLPAGRGYTDMVSATSHQKFRACHATRTAEIAGPFDECGSPVSAPQITSRAPAVETVRQADLASSTCAGSTPDESLHGKIESIGNYVVRAVPQLGQCDTGHRFTAGMHASLVGRTRDFVLVELETGVQGWVHIDSYVQTAESQTKLQTQTEPFHGSAREIEIRRSIMGADGVLDADEHAFWVDSFSSDLSIDEFFVIKGDPLGLEFLNWSDDGCSGPTPSFLRAEQAFTESCLRHDFCYRNNLVLGRSWMKERCDDQMGRDMAGVCQVIGSEFAQCERWAKIYLGAVRDFGRIDKAVLVLPKDSLNPAGVRNRYMCPHSGFYDSGQYICRVRRVTVV